MAKNKSNTTGKNNAGVGFEKELWAAACILRGNVDASEYKHVILGLIFLKYVSDRFEQRYNELVEEGEGFENEKDEYTKDGIFFVPKDARWSTIKAFARKPEIGSKIDEAMQAIERENKRLKGILPQNFARPELDKMRLGNVVDLFTNISMVSRRDAKNEDGIDENDLLGRTYEYCLKEFAAMEGKQAGEFFTPPSVVNTLVEVLQPLKGKVYDPCCGSGGMFVQSGKFIGAHKGRINDISAYGQDSNATTWKLCMMNLAIHGIEADLGRYNADTFFDDCHPTLKANFIMANPPFNLSNWGQDKLTDDKRWKFGLPPAGNANFAWIQHMLFHLAPGGRMGLVLANGSLSSQSGGEGEIRQRIVDEGLVEGIIALPGQLFYSTQIPATLWILSRGKRDKDKTLFVDARNIGHMVSRTLRELSDEDIAKIAKAFDQFRNGKCKDVKGFCAVADRATIAEHGYVLTPGRYVEAADIEDDGVPFKEKMMAFSEKLYEQMKESAKLDRQIKKNLAELGFGE